MKIFLSPQVSDKANFKYTFEGDALTVVVDKIEDKFDFAGLPDGILQMTNAESEELVETVFENSPLLDAEKKDGVLYLTLLNRISENATEEEKFPEWIDADDYVFKENKPEEEEEEDGEAELEESEGN